MFFSQCFPIKHIITQEVLKLNFHHIKLCSALDVNSHWHQQKRLLQTTSEPHGKQVLGYFLNANIVLDETSETKCGWAGCSVKPHKCKDWGSITLARDHSRRQITAPPPNKAPGFKQNKTPNQEKNRKQRNKTTKQPWLSLLKPTICFSQQKYFGKYTDQIMG